MIESDLDARWPTAQGLSRRAEFGNPKLAHRSPSWSVTSYLGNHRSGSPTGERNSPPDPPAQRLDCRPVCIADGKLIVGSFHDLPAVGQSSSPANAFHVVAGKASPWSWHRRSRHFLGLRERRRRFRPRAAGDAGDHRSGGGPRVRPPLLVDGRTARRCGAGGRASVPQTLNPPPMFGARRSRWAMPRTYTLTCGSVSFPLAPLASWVVIGED
jgi:hypothetical protein